MFYYICIDFLQSAFEGSCSCIKPMQKSFLGEVKKRKNPPPERSALMCSSAGPDAHHATAGQPLYEATESRACTYVQRATLNSPKVKLAMNITGIEGLV